MMKEKTVAESRFGGARLPRRVVPERKWSSNRSRCAGVLVAMALGACVIGAPSVATAQEGPAETELEAARRHYRDGLSLEAAGDWALALKKFEVVARVRLTPQVRFHIASNKEKLGRLTEALGDYRLAEYEATDVSDAELAEIREARESLERRIPRLQLTAGSGIEGATISLDGVEIGRDRLGEALPVDPGSHRVSVRFEDGSSATYAVQVMESHTEAVEIRGPEPVRAAPPKMRPPPSPIVVRDSGESTLWWPWVSGGIGVAGLATGGVMLYLRQDAINSLESNCSATTCPEQYKSTSDSGKVYSILAPVAFGVGVAGVGAAIVGWVLASKEESALGVRSRPLSVGVAVLPEHVGVTVSGGF